MRTLPLPRILPARPHGQDPGSRLAGAAAPIVERILAGHELACAETVRQAEELLRGQRFDLILCTIVFDESRMFELLELAKSNPQWQSIPFACAG